MGIYQSFVETVERYRGRPALIYLGEMLNYVDLFGSVELFATGLLSLGLKQGDRIILYLPNTPQWIIGWLAMQKIGAVAVPVAPIYTSRDLRYMSEIPAQKPSSVQTPTLDMSKSLRKRGYSSTLLLRASETPYPATRDS